MKRIQIIPLLALLAVLTTGCDNEGPGERAGEKFDEVTEDIRDKGEDLGNEIEDACEDAKDAMGAEDEDC